MSSTSSTMNVTLGGTKSGWMGERSMPVTCDSGWSSAKSMDHAPVPQPMSRTWSSFLGRGASWSLPSKVREKRWCCRSRRSFSLSSLGRR